MSKRYKVCGIGNAIVDMQLQVDESVINDFGLTKGGMTLVDYEKQESLIKSLAGSEFHQASGGSAANTMIALAQLGTSASYSCVVGADDLGTFYLQEMLSLRIALQTNPREGESTGTCLVFITPDAQRTMATHLGATAGFEKLDVNEEHLAQSEWLYVEGYLLSSASGQEAVRHAIKLAKGYDVKIAVTFSDAFIVNSFRDILEEVVDASDLVFANYNEASAFTNKETKDEVFGALKDRVDNVALTFGDEGARIHFAGEDRDIAPYSVKAVDDTGAGDMFAGGFLHGISSGLSGFEAGQLACFLASRVVAKLGPRLEGDVKELAKQEGLKV